MTPKQRLLAAIDGKETDRTPWSPFLAYYWDFLSKEITAAGKSVFDQMCAEKRYLEQLGADPLLRGWGGIALSSRVGCESRVTVKGPVSIETIETPVGSLTLERRASGAANTSFLYKHPVETEEDFKVLTYLYEHTLVTDDLKGFEEKQKAIGESALMLPLVGICAKTAFQSLVETWCGTQNLAYALCDFPEAVEACLQVMCEKDNETARIICESSAEAILFYEDSSTTNISPSMFKKYTAPEIRTWASMFHAAGKRLVHHACGHLRDLLPLMARTGIDAIESISPPPTGNIDLDEAIRVLPSDIALIGGIEPLFFQNCTLEELEKRVDFLLGVMKGRGFVLANSDSCPPGVAYEKFLLVSELVKKHKK